MIRLALLAFLLLAAHTQAADPRPQDEPAIKTTTSTPGANWRDRVAPVTTRAATAGDVYGLVQDTATKAVTGAQQAKVDKVNAAARQLWLARKGLLKAEQTLMTQASTGSKAARRAAAANLKRVRAQMADLMTKVPKASVDPKWAQRMETLGGLGDMASMAESYRTEGSWGVLKDRTHSQFQAATMGLAGIKGTEIGAAIGLAAGGPPGAIIGGTLGGAGGMIVGGAGYQYGAKPIVDKNLDEFGRKSGQVLRGPLQAIQRATGLAGGAPAKLTPEAEKLIAEQERKEKEAAERKRREDEAARRAAQTPPPPTPGEKTRKAPRTDGPKPGQDVPPNPPGDDEDAPGAGNTDDPDNDNGDTPGKNPGGGTETPERKDKDKDKTKEPQREPPRPPLPTKPGQGMNPDEDCNPEVPGPCFNQRHNWGEESQTGDTERAPLPPPQFSGDAPGTPPSRERCNPEVPGPCFNQRHERGDWEGFDADPGNLDRDRIAAGGGRSALPDDWRPGDRLPQGNQNAPSPGAGIDIGYTTDPIAEAERDREAAEQAERIAAAANPRRGRDRRGDHIADEFGTAPDTDRLPDPNRPKPPGEGGQDNARQNAPGDGGGAQPARPAPKPPATGGKPGNPPTPSDPPANGGKSDPGQPPRPPKPTGDDEAYCREIVGKMQAKIPAMMSTLQRLQSAAAAKDEALAQRLGCQYMADSQEVLGSFEAMQKANCPIQGDTRALQTKLTRTRSELQRGLAQECGVTQAYTNFAGSWRSSATCPTPGIAGNRWVVSLNQTGDQVGGVIAFHLCPGGGRAQYEVSGKASASETVRLSGRLTSSRGPLAEHAKNALTFSVKRGAPPSPNLAR